MYSKETKDLIPHIKEMISVFCVANNIISGESIRFVDVNNWFQKDDRLKKYSDYIKNKHENVEDVIEILEKNGDITYDDTYVGFRIFNTFFVNFTY